MSGMITDKVSNAYQSARLRYVRITEHDNAMRSFLRKLFDDPRVHAQTSTMLLRPTGKGELDYLMGEYSSALLGVAIWLLPSEVHNKGDKDAGAGPETKGVTIGELIVGEGGIPASIAHNRNASIGLAISPEYQGKGYGREAINWALDWAFRHGGMHTMSISTASFNTRAAQLYRDIGFVAEGRRRQVVWFDREWHDDLLFSMTEEEWEAVRGKGLVRHS